MRIFYLIPFFFLPLFAEPLSETKITERLKASEEATDDPVAAEAAKVWQQALVSLKAADSAVITEKKTRSEIARLEKLEPLSAPGSPAAGAALAEQEALLAKVSSLIESSEVRRKEVADRAGDSPKRMAILTEELTKARAALAEFEIPVQAPGELESAQYQKAIQDKRMLEAKIKQFEAEQDLLRRESELYTERIQRRKDYLNSLTELQTVLSSTVQKLKEEETRKTKEVIASLDEEFSHVPDLAQIVSELSELRSNRDLIQESIKEARTYNSKIDRDRKRIDEQYKNAKRRIKLLEDADLGIDDETGLLIRNQRSRLPSVDEISAKLRSNLELVAKAEISLLGLSDRVNGLPVLDEKRIAAIIAEDPKISRSRVDELLRQRADVMQKLSADYRTLNEDLSKGTEAAKLTITEIEEYSNFIDERLLWIKSTKPLHWREPLEEWGRVVDLFTPGTLGNLWGSIRSNWFGSVVPLSFSVIASLAIFIRRRSLLEILKESSLQAARRNCTSLVPTLKFLGFAILLSLWLPLVPFVISGLIDEPLSWKRGLRHLSILLFLGFLFLKFCRPDGLLVSHFKMPPRQVALFFKNLKWLVPVAVPFIFVVSALTFSGTGDSSGRFVSILGMLLAMGFCHHLFHPKRSVLQKNDEGTGLAKFGYLVVMAIPLLFAIGAGLGYFASVLILRAQFAATIGVLALAFLVIQFLTRWTLVSRRALAISQALRRREATLAQREREEKGGERSSELESLDDVKAEAVNVVEVEEQTIQLLRLTIFVAAAFGLWAIWSSTLPALSVLDKIELWGSGPITTEVTSSPAVMPNLSGEQAAPVDKVKEIISTQDGRVTLQDLLMSIVFFILTFAAARNIPGLLSLVFFNRINLGPGGNFALTTTVRYLIVLVGIVLALARIEITWDKVQWLAAAVSLGIGFGLQEIFANFVAGIILLFERPIRLGDIVTVGDISGKVTQIKIRATTIQQFNNRELLVPNKEFITSQLVNWTLKDSILRFEIPVGIAYGSDTGKATRILREIVSGHPQVMADPGPDVLFMSFGNSTLDFQIRGFVPAAEHLLATQSELHYQIDNAFREAGIEIAFPQQDIHIRSLPEGTVPALQS